MQSAAYYEFISRLSELEAVREYDNVTQADKKKVRSAVKVSKAIFSNLALIGALILAASVAAPLVAFGQGVFGDKSAKIIFQLVCICAVAAYYVVSLLFVDVVSRKIDGAISAAPKAVQSLFERDNGASITNFFLRLTVTPIAVLSVIILLVLFIVLGFLS